MDLWTFWCPYCGTATAAGETLREAIEFHLEPEFGCKFTTGIQPALPGPRKVTG